MKTLLKLLLAVTMFTTIYLFFFQNQEPKKEEETCVTIAIQIEEDLKNYQYCTNHQYLGDLVEEHKEELSSMVDEAVMEEMRLAEQQMVLPFDKEKNIHAQDDHFLAKKKLDLEHIKKPMLLHYHPLSIYRAQVCKQADVVLAHYLLDDEPLDVMKNSLDYYEEITTHDSSLSKCIFSIMYARTGNKEKAYEYFNEQLRMDTDNTLSNTHHGLHVANMGGTYLTIVSGFLGLRTNNGLSVRPYCPSEWRGYQVNLEYRGVSLSFEVKNTLRIKVSKPIDLWIYGKQIHINDSYEQEL